MAPNTLFFNSNDNSFLSIELMMVVLSKQELIDITNTIEQIATQHIVEQQVQLNYKNHFFKSKLISKTNSTITCGKDTIKHKKIVIGERELKAKIINRSITECVDGQVQTINISYNTKYELKDHPNWFVSIAVVKQMTNPQEFTTRMHEYKDRLLKDYTSFVNEVDESAYDLIAITLQYSGENILYSDMAKILTSLLSHLYPQDDSKNYQNILYSLAKEIYRDPLIANRFKEKSGFKMLTPSAIELSRTIYFKQVLPVIESFYITDKIDGLRTLLQITEIFKRSGSNRKLLGAEILSVSNKLEYIQKFDDIPSNARGIEFSKTIVDCEMVEHKNKRTFYVFDVIMLNNRKVNNLPFKLRHKLFNDVDALLYEYKLGRTKKFVKLTEKYKEEIELFYEEASQAKDYEIDGLIFTPEGAHYKEQLKQKFKTNTEYYNTISFKWKPLEQLTIDFYLMSIDPVNAKELLRKTGDIKNTSKHVYALCSGVDIVTFKRLNLEFFPGYVAPQSENSYQYFPIQFAPHDNPYMYVWTSDNDSLNGKVAEFKFINKQGERLNKPEIIRIRDDRVNDVRKGEYFGNALKYSELIWHSINYPLTFEMLSAKPSDIGGYFQSESTDEYFAQRAFNSFVKSELIDMYFRPIIKSGAASLVDLMCGKGQDLARTIEAGFTDITMMDRDVDAIYELLQRKYNLRIKTKDATAKVHIRRVDFEKTFEEICNESDIPTERGCVQAHFSLHYLTHDSSSTNDLPLVEFFKLVHHMLVPKGRFMVTCFDGKPIFNLLEDNDEWSAGNRKYSIKKAYVSKEFTNLNQAIDVLLPFSGGTYYQEYLVNFEFVESLLIKQGFTILARESFSTLFKQFKKNNNRIFSQLDDADKAYVSLYSYLVVEKN